jgi:hypothetical protein
MAPIVADQESFPFGRLSEIKSTFTSRTFGQHQNQLDMVEESQNIPPDRNAPDLLQISQGYRSFRALEIYGGDTQPITLAEITANKVMVPGASKSREHASQEENRFVETHSSQNDRDEAIVSDDDENPFALPQKPFREPPQTPTLARRKRKASEDLLSDRLSSAVKVPESLLKNLMSKDHHNLSLTQAFANTQVNTSPFANGPKSDPVFGRPSPEMPRYISPTSPLFNEKLLQEIAEADELTSPNHESLRIGDVDFVPTQVELDESLRTSVSPVQPIMAPVTTVRQLAGTGASRQDHDINAGLTIKNSSREDIDSPLAHRNLLEQGVKGTPDDIQVPRSSRNSHSNDNRRDRRYSPNTELEKIEATPINSLRHDSRIMKDHATQISDRITDSQSNTQEKGQQTSLAPSPLHRPGSKGVIYRTLPLEPELPSVLSPDTQYALASSSLARPPRSSPPGQDESKDSDNSQVEQPNLSKSTKVRPDEQNNPVFKKLSEIAAEPSQQELQMSLNFHDEDRTEAERAYDEHVFSGSSPVAPKNRKRLKRNIRKSPEVASFSEHSRSASCENTPNETKTNDEYDAEPDRIVLTSPITKQPSPLKSKHEILRGKLARPKGFLRAMDRKKQLKAARNALNKSRDIFEVEETQFQSAFPEDEDDVSVDEQVEEPVQVNNRSNETMIVDTSNLEICFPNRIFVYWPGPYDACFPATCLQTCQDIDGTQKLDIVDDGGTHERTSLGKSVYKLQLRAGDIVRVEQPVLNRKRYTVLGFKNQYQGSKSKGDENPPQTDIYGHQTVVLTVKSRDSLPGSTDLSNTIDVPISKLKLGRSEFVQFDDRRFIPTEPLYPSMRASSRLATSRSPSLLNSPLSTATDDATALPKILMNMAFAVSIGSDESDRNKSRILKSIVSSGARIINQSFEELFHPSSLPTDHNIAQTSDKVNLALAESSTSLGFTALITDEHSRKLKYMQALALDLPILHYRWIDDSVSAGKALPWTPYLLPAGKSAFLKDAIRSRSLAPYSPTNEDAAFEHVLMRRHVIFQGNSILFIRGRSTHADEVRKMCMFLLAAQGASRISSVADLAEAEKALDSEEWDFVYANDHEKTQKALGNGSCRILAHETVVQSLILSGLYSPEVDV